MSKLVNILKKKGPSLWLRYLLLGGLLVYVSYIGYMHLQHQTEFPPVDALCPFGGLESLYSVIFQGEFLQRIFISSFILLGITILLVAVTGRTFCGWICPLGTLQGIFGSIGKRLFGRKQRISLKSDRKIRWIRYPILLIFTVGAWYGGRLLIRPYDPWVAWMHIWDFGEVVDEFLIGLIILVGSLTLAAFLTRPFCRYLCPMGIFLGLLNRFSLIRLEVDQDKCIHCYVCDKRCPVGIPIESMTVIDKTECLSCNECVPACPIPDTLYYRFAGGKKINPMVIGVTVVVVFFGGLGITKAVGIYQSTPKHAADMKAEGGATPEDIRGYMTLGDIAMLFDIDLDSLYSALALDREEVSPYVKTKGIAGETGSEFETDSVRIVVARMLNVPLADASCAASSDTDAPPAILGTNTLREAAEIGGVDLGALYERLGLDSMEIPPDTPCRDLKEIVSPDFHTSKVREAVEELSKK